MTESKGEKAKCQSGKKERTRIGQRGAGKQGYIILRGEEVGRRRRERSIIGKSS